MVARLAFFDLSAPGVAPLEWTAEESGQFALPIVTPLLAAFRSDPAKNAGTSAARTCLRSRLRSRFAGALSAPRGSRFSAMAVLDLFRDPGGNPLCSC